MPTDTITPTLVINKLSKAQYETIPNPSDTELYLVPDDDLREHRSYYTTGTATVDGETVDVDIMYEGVAPEGSVETDAVWTITTIVATLDGNVLSNDVDTDQTWDYPTPTPVVPTINTTPIYRGSYNIVTDLGLTTISSQSDIIIALENEISTPQYANYCFVDIPYANYSEVSGYDQFTTTSDYVDYYVLVGDVYTLVTDDNKDTLGIIVGTTVAYSVSYTSYFEKIQRYRYNGNSWEYEYDVDFSGYANVDASNFTDSGTTFLSGLGMPSDRYERLTVGASGSNYTAPANGWFSMDVLAGTVNCMITRGLMRATGYKPNGWGNGGCLMPVMQRQTITMWWAGTTQTNIRLYFFYAEGTPTPPQP